MGYVTNKNKIITEASSKGVFRCILA